MNIICRLFGHKMKLIWEAEFPSAVGTPVHPGMGGGRSLSIKQDWGCERCPFVEERRSKWD